MSSYQKYINALRKCAKEHENDRTSTGHIIVSDLCRDTANLLEELEQDPALDTRQRERQLEMEYQHGYDKGWEEGKKSLEQPTRWIPVSEKLPEKFDNILCNTDSGIIFIAIYYGKMNNGIPYLLITMT